MKTARNCTTEAQKLESSTCGVEMLAGGGALLSYLLGKPMPGRRHQVMVASREAVVLKVPALRTTTLPSPFDHYLFFEAAKRIGDYYVPLTRYTFVPILALRFDLLALQPFAKFRPSSPARYIADRNGNRLLLSDEHDQFLTPGDPGIE